MNPLDPYAMLDSPGMYGDDNPYAGMEREKVRRRMQDMQAQETARAVDLAYQLEAQEQPLNRGRRWGQIFSPGITGNAGQTPAGQPQQPQPGLGNQPAPQGFNALSRPYQ